MVALGGIGGYGPGSFGSPAHEAFIGEQYTEPHPNQRPYQPYGGVERLFYTFDPYVLIEGPAGTGKTRGCLEKLRLIMELWPGVRLLMLRKTRASLTQSSMVTWEQKVLTPDGFITFSTTDQEYRHPNGSIMAVAGLDKPSKLMSTEWDVIFIPEATELTQDEFEYVTTRNRNFGGGIPYQQIILDANPQGPKHWLNVLSDTPVFPQNPGGPKVITRIRSKHKDNPEFWDMARQTWTPRGRTYLSNLKKLTGVRFYRLFKGVWRQAEGVIYEEWNEEIHRPFLRRIPKHWPRFWVVDFGYNDPFVWQEWALDEDRRLWRINEIYRTHKLVREHCRDIIKITHGSPRPAAVICDHDAEGRYTLEDELGIKTTLAPKLSILENIENARHRLAISGDGQPRAYFMRDCLYEHDPLLREKHLPVCTEDEFELYQWADDAKKDRPIDMYNHGMDCFGYICAYVDQIYKKGSSGVKQHSYTS